MAASETPRDPSAWARAREALGAVEGRAAYGEAEQRLQKLESRAAKAEDDELFEHVSSLQDTFDETLIEWDRAF